MALDASHTETCNIPTSSEIFTLIKNLCANAIRNGLILVQQANSCK